MRIAWITPGYPPARGGVSDHSFAIVSALEAQGHDVRVYSNPHEMGFSRLDAQLAAYRPEIVIVAYVPLGFAPRTGGVSPRFVYWCIQLRRRLNAGTLLLAHEASLPTAYNWARRELKLVALSVAQVAQFEILARALSCVVFSNEATRDLWAGRIPRLRARLKTVRICSNIPLVRAIDPRAELEVAGHLVPEKIVLFFGTGHDSVLFDYIEAALTELLRVEPGVRLVIVGIDPTMLRQRAPSLAEFGSHVQALGYVPAHDVSLWLQTADLVLAPFVEGVTARKGTVMAAFQHGCAVITTRGIHTRDDIAWDRMCALAPLERAAFAALAALCFQDSEWRAQLGAVAQADYETHASASVTAAQLAAYAQSQR
jgi:glycosyltransferase involved in cell wall biosynthesis